MNEQTPGDTKATEFDSLELPSLTPGSLARKFGPGMMLMMTGIGTSHLVTAPVAGGRFGYALLWCLPIAYIFKYYGFEMAIRFTHATGRSMLDAYATAWKKLPVWYVLITTVIQSAVGQAGRLIAAAAVVFYFFRMFFVTGAIHRYFSHRAFRTSRSVQLAMAILGCTAGQRGPLWWAAHHRHHDRGAAADHVRRPVCHHGRPGDQRRHARLDHQHLC